MNPKEKEIFERILTYMVPHHAWRNRYRLMMKQAGESEPDHETAKRILERATDPERKWEGRGKKKTDAPDFTEIHVPLKDNYDHVKRLENELKQNH